MQKKSHGNTAVWIIKNITPWMRMKYLILAFNLGVTCIWHWGNSYNAEVSRNCLFSLQFVIEKNNVFLFLLSGMDYTWWTMFIDCFWATEMRLIGHNETTYEIAQHIFLGITTRYWGAKVNWENLQVLYHYHSILYISSTWQYIMSQIYFYFLHRRSLRCFSCHITRMVTVLIL